MGIFYKKSDIPDHLQKYFVPAEIGLEQTPEQYIAAMVEVFRCVRDVLADDGTLSRAALATPYGLYDLRAVRDGEWTVSLNATSTLTLTR